MPVLVLWVKEDQLPIGKSCELSCEFLEGFWGSKKGDPKTHWSKKSNNPEKPVV